MRYYECYFSSAEWKNADKINKKDHWLISQLCKCEYQLSYNLVDEFFNLDDVDSDSSWVGFAITKQKFQELEFDDLNEHDWWFVRTMFDCFAQGFENLYIDLWKHFVIMVG